DNFVLQPQIYSKRVNAHPIEIFLIMMMGGSVGGIIGMILAVPAYTLIRIVGKEFLSSFDLMDKLTRNL
nr:AI-2E family transporter [Bacteroidales bacterium]